MNSLFSVTTSSVPTPATTTTSATPPASNTIVDRLWRSQMLRHSPKSGMMAGGRGGGGSGSGGAAVSLNAMDSILEKETSHNKTESWNRLDKTVKLQKLAAFAEKYGRDHALSAKDVLSLRTFFQESLEKNKLQRTKDVIYDKEAHEIKAVPALYYNTTSRHFTLRITDTKRVSTLKSLTPLRRSSVDASFTNTILSPSTSDKVFVSNDDNISNT